MVEAHRQQQQPQQQTNDEESGLSDTCFSSISQSQNQGAAARTHNPNSQDVQELQFQESSPSSPVASINKQSANQTRVTQDKEDEDGYESSTSHEQSSSSFSAPPKRAGRFLSQNERVEHGSSIMQSDVIPPPEPLLPKTFGPIEPLKTGSSVPFLKLRQFSHISKEEPKAQLDKVDKLKYKIENPILNEQNFKAMFSPDSRSENPSQVVYNRYYNHLAAAFNRDFSNLRSDQNPMTMLVNVKDLIANEVKQQQQSAIGSIVLPYYSPTDPSDKTLVFESRFESGNLAMALKLSNNEYNLVLQNDINTKGHTQWFFFRVSNTKADLSVKFNLLNHTKPDSLFNYGMQVLVFSESKNQQEKVGWHRDGRDIAYYQNIYKKENLGRSRYFYTLTFTYDFKTDDDVVYFAYCYPYTYTELTEDLTKIEKDAVKSQYVSRNTLCRTIAGNKCEYLTITSKTHFEKKQPKKGVFLSARIHPGESNSSWMMKGAIDFLTSEAVEAQILREKFIFKVVPMLNPDGVVNGNYRCSLAGADLNRRWKTGSKVLYPEVFETKKIVKQFQKERQMVLYCDMHGHSRDKNVFMYGNNYPENPESTRLYPFIMSKICQSFNYGDSKFTVHKSKEATSRITMWRELKVPAVYTMEASFCGPNFGPQEGFHYTVEDFMDIGANLCLGLFIYCDIDIPKSLDIVRKQQQQQKASIGSETENSSCTQEKVVRAELYQYNRKDLIAELMGNKDLLISGGKDTGGDDEGGSDSEPSEDNMDEDEIAKIIPVKVATKKKLDTKQQQQLHISRKTYKQEEQKVEQKQQQTSSPIKKSPAKRINTGGSFFDRVRLPKSFGLRRVEMIDAWTQTSNRGDSDIEFMASSISPSKDEGTQAYLTKYSNIDISPTRVNKNGRFDSPQKVSDFEGLGVPGSHNMFNIELSQVVHPHSPEKGNTLKQQLQRPMVSATKQLQNAQAALMGSPTRGENATIKDRVQAMQIINQYIKDTTSQIKTGSSGSNNDSYNFMTVQQQQLLQQQISQQQSFQLQSSFFEQRNSQQQQQQLPVSEKKLTQYKEVVHEYSNNHRRQDSQPQPYYIDSARNSQNNATHNNNNNNNKMPIMLRGKSEGATGIAKSGAISPLKKANIVGNINVNDDGDKYNFQQLSNEQQNLIGSGLRVTTNNINSSNSGVNELSYSSNGFIRQSGQTPLSATKEKQYQSPVVANSGSMGITKNSEYSYKQAAGGSNSQQNSSQKSQFNTSQLIQNQGNSRATTLPSLNNESIQQKSMVTKTTKQPLYYDQLKSQQSFKLSTSNNNLNQSALLTSNDPNSKNNYSLLCNEQLLPDDSTMLSMSTSQYVGGGGGKTLQSNSNNNGGGQTSQLDSSFIQISGKKASLVAAGGSHQSHSVARRRTSKPSSTLKKGGRKLEDVSPLAGAVANGSSNIGLVGDLQITFQGSSRKQLKANETQQQIAQKKSQNSTFAAVNNSGLGGGNSRPKGAAYRIAK